MADGVSDSPISEVSSLKDDDDEEEEEEEKGEKEGKQRKG
jgi:hypothetical protein